MLLRKLITIKVQINFMYQEPKITEELMLGFLELGHFKSQLEKPMFFIIALRIG
jgi:hypothetical protein